jgi:uncharacterized protein YpmB
MQPNNNQEPTPNTPQVQPLTNATPQPMTPMETPIIQSSVIPETPQKSKKTWLKILLIIIGIIIVIVVSIFALSFMTYNNSKSEGEKVADAHIALLEASDKDALEAQTYQMLDVDPSSDDIPTDKLQKITTYAIAMSFASNALKTTDAEKYNAYVGKKDDGTTAVRVYYSFDANGQTAYYTVTTVNKDGKYVLDSVAISDTKPEIE